MEVYLNDFDNVMDYLKRIPERAFEDAKEIFEDTVIKAANTVKEFKDLRSRTGSLRRSIGQQVSGTMLSSLNASVYSAQGTGGTQVKYAPMQEFGGKVSPVNNKYAKVPGGPYLNIPVADNLTPAGVMRESAREVFMSGEGRIAKGPSGKWLVFKGNKLMFVLVKEVTLKPRLGMYDAAEAEIPTLLSRLAAIIGEER